jgi:hypothetical protein
MGNCWRRFFLFLPKKIRMATWDGELLEMLLELRRRSFLEVLL